jgi:hypothetical protein
LLTILENLEKNLCIEVQAEAKKHLDWPKWLNITDVYPVHSSCTISPNPKDEKAYNWAAQKPVYVEAIFIACVHIEGGYYVYLFPGYGKNVLRVENAQYAVVLEPGKWIEIALNQITPAEQVAIQVSFRASPGTVNSEFWNLQNFKSSKIQL